MPSQYRSIREAKLGEAAITSGSLAAARPIRQATGTTTISTVILKKFCMDILSIEPPSLSAHLQCLQLAGVPCVIAPERLYLCAKRAADDGVKQVG